MNLRLGIGIGMNFGYWYGSSAGYRYRYQGIGGTLANHENTQGEMHNKGYLRILRSVPPIP